MQDLQRRRATLDAEIERVRAGDLPLLGDTALKERFTQFATLARELLADFRDVDHNFRGLDRRVTSCTSTTSRRASSCRWSVRCMRRP